MIVYRVEDAGKRGPYHGATVDIYQFAQRNRPMPEDDKIYGLGDEWNWRYGFESIDKLKRWFGKRDRARLARAGYVIARYDAEQVKVGRRQVVFRVAAMRGKGPKPRAERLDTLDLGDI